MPLAHLGVLLLHAAVGWALCGATMGIAMARTPERRAIVIHAVAAPVIVASTLIVVPPGGRGDRV